MEVVCMPSWLFLAGKKKTEEPVESVVIEWATGSSDVGPCSSGSGSLGSTKSGSSEHSKSVTQTSLIGKKRNFKL